MAEGVSIKRLHEAILGAISDQFPNLATVTAYEKVRDRIEVPAVLLNLAEMERSGDPGTEQLCLKCRFDLFVVMDALLPAVGCDIRSLSGDLALYVQGNRFGLPVSPAEVVGLAPSEFSPALDQYEEWCLTWTQEICLGSSCWDGEGVLPTEALYSIVPLVGVEHVDAYRPLEEVPHDKATS